MLPGTSAAELLVAYSEISVSCEPLHVKNTSSGFPTRSSSNSAVQPQKMARGLKFQNKEVDGLYYLCSENKGADQGSTADLCLCFHICKRQVFS